ncbi:MAG: hypothetical protein Q9164_002818, partial [Protoblastenia rupestris]
QKKPQKSSRKVVQRIPTEDGARKGSTTVEQKTQQKISESLDLGGVVLEERQQDEKEECELEVGHKGQEEEPNRVPETEAVRRRRDWGSDSWGKVNLGIALRAKGKRKAEPTEKGKRPAGIGVAV